MQPTPLAMAKATAKEKSIEVTLWGSTNKLCGSVEPSLPKGKSACNPVEI